MQVVESFLDSFDHCRERLPPVVISLSKDLEGQYSVEETESSPIVQAESNTSEMVEEGNLGKRKMKQMLTNGHH